MDPSPITELLPELRRQKGWSRERLAHEAFAFDREGVSVAQISAIERGVRRPSPRTMLALAQALELEPTVFPEFRLAVVRHIFDEAKVGLEEALRNADRFGIEPVEVSPEEIRRFSHQGLGHRDRSERGDPSAGPEGN